MALPKLNSLPEYEIIIPSTKEKKTYRPYVVAEEKLLLLAMESKEEKDMALAIMRLIESCVENINVKTLTTYDLEYIFLKLRSKSVGETSFIGLKCGSCSHLNEIAVDISSVEVTDFNPKEKMIKINDEFTIEMRHVPYNRLIEKEMIGDNRSVVESLYRLVMNSMYALHTPEERILFEEEPEEEVIKFLNGMTTPQFDRLRAFVENTPMVKKDIDFNCSSCGTKNAITLEGLSDFF